MANKWVPPIPTEKLYSPAALELGAGLALLIWCYDGIERDGSLRIDLNEACSELGKPYRTVKEWWRMIRIGPFFSSVKDRGKLGYVATFNRDWIEWRVMETNYPTEQISEGQKTALDNIPSKPVQGQSDVLEGSSKPVQSPVKAASRTDEGQKTALDLYIGTPIDQESEHIVAANAATTQSEKKPRKPKPEPQSPIEVRKVVAIGSQIDLEHGLKEDRIQVANIARDLWRDYRLPDEPVETFVIRVRKCGQWVRKTRHPYSKNPEQRIPPSALKRFWPGWVASLEHTNGSANGGYAPLPAEDPNAVYVSAEEMRAAMPTFIRVGGVK